MKIKSFIIVVVVSLITSMVGCGIVLGLVQKKSSTTSDQSSVKLVTDGSTKSQNVYQAVAQKASPSVVGIVSETESSNSFFESSTVEQGVGTGFVVDKRGYILTNSHVVSDGKAKNVNVIYSDKETSKGKVVWYDQNLDLAIVKVDKKGLVPAELGNSDDVTVGDVVIAIGNPLGTQLMSSVTQGIISGLDRDVSTSTSNMSGLLQTDASINPGNSGGPLLNQDGQVIGINTVKANADNLGFSIPVNTAKLIVQKVIDEGDYEKVVLGITGIDVQTLKMYTGQDLGVSDGIIIRAVQDNSIASKAGLKEGDIIVKMGDTKIKNMGEITKKLYSYKKGSTEKIEIVRDGKEKTLDVKF
ncbi:S1C family serine protease [Peptostreptococcus faecalis]|uniref:S1C family serine protease n=1 Tax=Peptostreptococcus faecalis TaxID=2045015 RepID=UPI000C7A0D25|nr:trypsin-like peptidase domain-containing protein [Peptostreptococcus faecalis]